MQRDIPEKHGVPKYCKIVRVHRDTDELRKYFYESHAGQQDPRYRSMDVSYLTSSNPRYPPTEPPSETPPNKVEVVHQISNDIGPTYSLF